jgi:ribosomal protein S27E
MLQFSMLLLHQETSAEEWLSVALWVGFAVLGGLVLIGALLAVRTLAGRSALNMVPCRGCAHFFDASKNRACPFCGQDLPDAPGGKPERSPE